MLAASIPAKFSIPWANSAGVSYINAIPTASQIGITAGAASLTDGFPPTTMQTGGTPPAGPDFNGILKWVTQWGQWQAAGGPVAYDSAFQTAISGYPKGAVVASATTFGVSWMSAVDANATNPDAGGAGWVRYNASVIAVYLVTTTQTLTFPIGSTRARIKGNSPGAGGGGCYGSGSAGVGGGGGAYIDVLVSGQAAGNTLAFVIGANGVAGQALSTPTAGGNSGTSTITGTGASISFSAAVGGVGGLSACPSTPNGGSVATISGANVTVIENIPGYAGTGGFLIASGATVGGKGGASPRSGGAYGDAIAYIGQSGGAPGVGGTGGSSGTLAYNGGSGAGASFVVEFLP